MLHSNYKIRLVEENEPTVDVDFYPTGLPGMIVGEIISDMLSFVYIHHYLIRHTHCHQGFKKNKKRLVIPKPESDILDMIVKSLGILSITCLSAINFIP